METGNPESWKGAQAVVSLTTAVTRSSAEGLGGEQNRSKKKPLGHHRWRKLLLGKGAGDGTRGSLRSGSRYAR